MAIFRGWTIQGWQPNSEALAYWHQLIFEFLTQFSHLKPVWIGLENLKWRPLNQIEELLESEPEFLDQGLKHPHFWLMEVHLADGQKVAAISFGNDPLEVLMQLKEQLKAQLNQTHLTRSGQDLGLNGDDLFPYPFSNNKIH